jgi:adenosine deaminase
MARPLTRLPKAHLHLHFTGGMRHSTLVDLAREHRVHLPEALVEEWPPRLRGTDERGWFRFQRLYDIARSVVRTEADVRRLLHEVAQDERDEGSGWLEIQVDPSGYAARFGGLTSTVELILDAAAAASAATGVGIGVIVAANRTRHPLDARTLARLAVAHAGRGVTGFGLSNDERRGAAADFAPAFRIAARAGLLAVPHGGELSGPASVRACLDELHADRVGHGVAAIKDQELTERIVSGRITLEVCPSSNVALGVAATPADVPLRPLLDAGVRVALGADDPLLFGRRLNAQYQIARQVHGMSDGELADLARMSLAGSVAPADVRARLMSGIDAWLAAPETLPDEATSAPIPSAGAAPAGTSLPGASSPADATRPRRDASASPWPVVD